MTPHLISVMRLDVLIAEPIVLGDIGSGVRRVIPITGGTFETSHGNGVVLAGGADWNLKIDDRLAEAWARYTLRSDSGEYIDVTNHGYVDEYPDGSFAGTTRPSFEVDLTGSFASLARRIYVGTLAPLQDQLGVRLEYFAVERA